MYTKKEFQKQVQLFRTYHRAPIQELANHAQYSRQTVVKFFNQDPSLRSYKRDTLIGLVIQLNEEAQEKRKELQVRSARSLRIEHRLNLNDRIITRHTSK